MHLQIPFLLPGAPLSMQCRREHGFTLIEMLVALALAGVLAAFAIPSYRRVMQNNQRAEGRAALLQTMVLQERYFSANRAYAAFGAGAVVPEGFRTFSGATPESSAYRIDAGACERDGLQDCVRVFATPRDDDAVCGVLSIDSLGRQAASGTADSASAACWPS